MISLTYRISKSQSMQRQAIGGPDKYQIWLIGKLKGIIFGKPLKYKMLWSIGICLGKGYLDNSCNLDKVNILCLYLTFLYGVKA